MTQGEYFAKKRELEQARKIFEPNGESELPGTLIVLFYLLMVVFTFGHSFNGPKVCMFAGEQVKCDTAERGITSTFSAIAWPLYWSMQIQIEDSEE